MGKYLDIPARFITESYTDSVVESDKTVENVQPDEEVYEECDMFIELGDKMFYVSEYHNALFDDPDAHDEAINEFGILLDSYDDEVIQETEKPYDEYLKKYNYDKKTNTIFAPNYERMFRSFGGDPVSGTIENPWSQQYDPDDRIDFLTFIKLGEQHNWDIFGDPKKNKSAFVRISAGKLGSAKERNRLNKFLRENGYDPKTETILTDMNDPKIPGKKMRVKFGLNSVAGFPSYELPDDNLAFALPTEVYGPGTISISKKLLTGKPGKSNQVFKHEEGHLAYGSKLKDSKKANKPGHHSPKEFRSDMRDARKHLRDAIKKNPELRFDDHDSSADEYQADKYAADHNKYGRGYQGALLQKLRDLMVDSNAKESVNKKSGLKNRLTGQRDAIVSMLGPGKEGLEKYKRFLRDNIRELEQLVKDPSDPDYQKNKARLKHLKDEAAKGFPEANALWKNVITQTDDEKFDAYVSQLLKKPSPGDVSRIEFAKKVAKKADKREKAEAAKKRQLSKEQLQQQLDSGKLSKDQAAKASKKIARIQQFEERQGKAPQQPKKSGGKKSAKKK